MRLVLQRILAASILIVALGAISITVGGCQQDRKSTSGDSSGMKVPDQPPAHDAPPRQPVH